MRRVILVCAAAMLMLAPAWWALAAEDSEEESIERQYEELEEQAREGLATLMMALETFIEQIPQYELPEVLDNGDIIIRRVNPEAPPEEVEGESKEI